MIKVVKKKQWTRSWILDADERERRLSRSRLSFDRISLISVVVFLLMTTACQPEGRRNDKLIVAVAANVQYAMDEIEIAFETQSGIEIEVITGSSGKLSAQIQQGAPYDVLVSADMKYPQSLHEKGFAASPPQVYAYGSLVLWTLRDLSLDSIITLLQQPEVRKIALANPKIAPYGYLTIQWLQYHQLLSVIESKLIYGESIAQASQYISSGACDIGFTASSIVVSPGMKDKGRWVPLKPDFKLEQGVVITKRGEKQPLETQAFYNFLFSDTAQAVFSRYGYNTPGSNSPTR